MGNDQSGTRTYGSPAWIPVCVVLFLMVGYLGLKLRGLLSAGPQEAQAHSTTKLVGESAARPKVLLVHSYHSGYPWVDAITRGVRMVLSSGQVDLQILYMDTKRNTDEAFKREAGESAKKVAAEWQPHVIIAADDNAQKYFATGYMGRSDVQIVGCGVNAEPQEYGYPAANATAVLERPRFQETIKLLHRFVPGAQRIALLSDDSPTSTGALQFMRGEDIDGEIVSVDMATTFEEWKDLVKRLETTADAIAVYMYHTLKEPGRTQSLDATSVMRWTVEHSSLPVVGFFIFAVDDGALCGYLESGVEHGMRAGTMAQEILAGRSAGEIAIVTALEGRSMLNLTTARKLGIEIPDDVIADVEVLVED